MNTQRLTTAQALILFLKNQYVNRDGTESSFFAGAWGIFGHGNVAGIGQALQQNKDFPYYLARSEQGMTHIATAFTKMNNRLRTFACTSSIGPGATNMITGAATATVNRLPLLLLPGDIFARRNVAPVLQQIESDHSQDSSVNDAFKSVSKYWDRINRPDQLPYSLLEAMRVLTSPANTGAVTLALPQDVQTEAWDYPDELFKKRIWTIARSRADLSQLKKAAQMIRSSKKPFIVSGGGTIYSEATQALDDFVTKTGIPVGETHAGKGSLLYDHPQNLDAVGVTGTPGSNIIAREADLVICVGTRLSDFTTASKTAFQNPDVKFISINVAEFDAFKQGSLPLVADAKVTLEELVDLLEDYQVDSSYSSKISEFKDNWETEVTKLTSQNGQDKIRQSEIIRTVNEFSQPEDIMVNAAGSLPGDLHKLWRTKNTKGYHMEYGNSCMGYEIAGGLGVKMADPSREVYVMVGDGSYLMLSSEILTSIQEGYKLNIVLINNHGFSSIGGLSKSIGSEGFGTNYRYRDTGTQQLDGNQLPVDFAKNAESLGALVIEAKTVNELQKALVTSKQADRTTVIVLETDKDDKVPGFESWWDVPIAEVSDNAAIQDARKEYEKSILKEKNYL
ncbi:MAG: 3D-(3,5/4)-trihydroxycyclohexane-1,2-dione acylhydrolase (decyclizing) [Balneolales bacterium]